MSELRGYDQRCYDLADTFLFDTGEGYQVEEIEELAREIQRTVDDFIDHGGHHAVS